MKKVLTAAVGALMALLPTPLLAGAPLTSLMLGGELGNSSTTCAKDIESNFAKVAGMGANTILVPVCWNLTEPTEGTFDFTLTDKIIETARRDSLGVVFLWFGAWKNSMSCYAPDWVKLDSSRFPRAETAGGRRLEILSPFSDAVAEADCTAFEKWLTHLVEADTAGVVKMVQIENEIGMLEDARDYSPLANEEYSKGVPAELLSYLDTNFTALHPSLQRRWTDAGRKMRGSWREVFGDDIFSDEYFMAWAYARYVERLASRGRQLTDIPFYLNAALNSRGRLPGEYPSAGPLAHLKDFWHAGAPSVNFLSPDIYDNGFADWVAQYALPDNTLFLPEVRREQANGAQAYYVVGRHGAIGFSPFAIELGDDSYAASLRQAYSTLAGLSPLLADGDFEFKTGVLLTSSHPEEEFSDGDTRITLSHFFTLPWDPRATDGSEWPASGAILLRLSPDEYLMAGRGVVAKFEDVSEGKSSASLGEDGFLNSGADRNADAAKQESSLRVGLLSVEEVEIDPQGALRRVRSLNGDETHQGRHARISVDDDKILHIKTYRY